MRASRTIHVSVTIATFLRTKYLSKWNASQHVIQSRDIRPHSSCRTGNAGRNLLSYTFSAYTFRPAGVPSKAGEAEFFALHIVTQTPKGPAEPCNLSPFVCAGYACHRGGDRTPMARRHMLNVAAYAYELQACRQHRVFTALL